MSNFKGIFSLEENQELLETPEVTSDVTDFVESPEVAMVEVDEAIDGIETVVEDMEEAETTADVLEVIADKVEETIPEGGLSEPVAAAIDVAVEHLKQRLGMPARHTSFAIEGFADKATRSQSTSLAVEDWKADIKKIWDAIVGAFASAIKWVKEFFTKLFDLAERAKARAEKLEEQAKAKAGKEAPADAKISTSSFGKLLSINGKVPEGSELPHALAASTKAAVSAQALVEKLTDVLAKVTVESLKTPDADVKYDFPMGDKVTAPDGYTSPEGTELSGTKLVFGGAVAYLQTAVYEAGKKPAKVKAWVGKEAGYKDPEDGEVSPLSVADIASVANICKTHMASYAKAKDVLKAIDKVEKEVLGNIRNAAKTTDEAESKAAIKATRAVASSLVSVVSQGLSSIRSYDVKVANAAMNYAGASLKKVA